MKPKGWVVSNSLPEFFQDMMSFANSSLKGARFPNLLEAIVGK